MRLVVAATILAAATLSGCTEAPGVSLLTGGAGDAPPPFFREHRADVEPGHEARYAFDVGERAHALNLTLALQTRTHGLPGEDVAPATLRIEIVAPSGLVLASGEVDARDPDEAIVLLHLPERGEHVAIVTGSGFSHGVEGATFGASYLLTVEVLHR